jgi:CHAD domain-containing protein
MARRQREREDKYEVGSGFAMPDLDDLVPPGGRLTHSVVHMDSRYFDTAERDLLASRVTLRRRLGDADTGWQLKVPEGKARTEIRLDADGEAVPHELVELVHGIGRGRQLVEVARIRTERTVRQVEAPDHSTVVEIADDQVHAVALGEQAALTQWREVEVELGDADEAILDDVHDRLVHAGARPATSASKLARALHTDAREQPTEPSCGTVVTDYLRHQYAELVAGDIALRQGQDAIHATRVALRRIRSTLRVFGALFDERSTRGLDAELAWYADLLGDVRDRQVQRARFAAAFDQLPDELVLASSAAEIDAWLQEEQRVRGGRLQAALNSERYLRLLGDVRHWTEGPPLTEAAGGAPSMLKDYARRARRKAGRRLRRAAATATSASPGDNDRGVDVALHRARKAAKRARYAVELARPAYKPKRAKKIIKEYKALQDVLGEHQDAVVAAELLHDHATATGEPPSFAYGLLYAHEDATAAQTRKRAVTTAS